VGGRPDNSIFIYLWVILSDSEKSNVIDINDRGMGNRDVRVRCGRKLYGVCSNFDSEFGSVGVFDRGRRALSGAFICFMGGLTSGRE